MRALICTLAACLFWLAVMVASPDSREPTRPCATEDSAGPCYWNAGVRGNGAGRSFIVDSSQHVRFVKGN